MVTFLSSQVTLFFNILLQEISDLTEFCHRDSVLLRRPTVVVEVKIGDIISDVNSGEQWRPTDIWQTIYTHNTITN